MMPLARSHPPARFAEKHTLLTHTLDADDHLVHALTSRAVLSACCLVYAVLGVFERYIPSSSSFLDICTTASRLTQLPV